MLAGERASKTCLYLVLAPVSGNLITRSHLRNHHLHVVLTWISFDLMNTYGGFLLRGVNYEFISVSSVGHYVDEVQKLAHSCTHIST